MINMLVSISGLDSKIWMILIFSYLTANWKAVSKIYMFINYIKNIITLKLNKNTHWFRNVIEI